MRFVLGALSRFWWLPVLLAAAGAGGIAAYESSVRAVRHVAVAVVNGRQAVDLLQDPATAQLAAALAAAHHEGRQALTPDYWKGATDDLLKEAVNRKGLLADPARWPEVRIVDGPRISVRVDGERVEAVAGEAEDARLAANARAAAAVVMGRFRQRDAALRVESLDTRVEIAELDAGPVEEQAKEMERRMAALQGTADAIERQVEDVKARQDRAAARIRALEAVEHRLRESLPAGPEENGLTSALYESLTVEREKARAERALKMAGRTAEDPEVRRLTARMADLELEIRKELFIVRERAIVAFRNSLDSMESELRSLDERRLRKTLEMRELSDLMRSTGPLRAEVGRLKSDRAAAEALRNRLGDETVPLAVLQAEAVDTLRTGGPRSGVAGTAAGIGAAIGLLLAFMLRGADRRVRSGEDVKRRLGVGVLGLASEVRGDPLILRAHPHSEASTDYSLAGGILRGYLEEREFRTVLVTSGAAGEGKSTAAANLAISLARKGMSVALLDADLRAPRQAALFGLDDSQGLTTALMGGEFQAELPAGATDLASLRVLVAGPTADLPGELLETARMADILKALRDRYQVVVIDGPPVGAGGDAVTLARLADTVAWVVRAGRLSAGRLGWVKHIFKNVGADVAGVLLVGATEGAAERDYAYPVTAAR